MSDIKIASNKSFGIVFFVVFLLISLYPLVYGSELIIWTSILSIAFLILGLKNSKILTPLNKLWFKFGLLLGRIISPIVMGLIFFLVVTPVGIAVRILKKNFFNLRFNTDKTYWIEKKELKSKMKNQF